MEQVEVDEYEKVISKMKTFRLGMEEDFSKNKLLKNIVNLGVEQYDQPEIRTHSTKRSEFLAGGVIGSANWGGGRVEYGDPRKDEISRMSNDKREEYFALNAPNPTLALFQSRILLEIMEINKLLSNEDLLNQDYNVSISMQTRYNNQSININHQQKNLDNKLFNILRDNSLNEKGLYWVDNVSETYVCSKIPDEKVIELCPNPNSVLYKLSKYSKENGNKDELKNLEHELDICSQQYHHIATADIAELCPKIAKFKADILAKLDPPKLDHATDSKDLSIPEKKLVI